MKKVYEDAAAQGGKKIGYAAGLVVAAGLGLAFVSAPTAAMALDEGADSAVRVQAVEAVDVDGARTATSQEVASATVSQTAAGDAASSDAAASDSVTPSEGATGGAAAEGDKAATDGPSDGSAEGNKKPGQPEAGGPSTETDGSKADGSGSGAGGGVAEGEAGAKPGPAGAEAGVLHKHELHLIENVFELDSKPITAIMTQRDDVVFLTLDDTADGLRRKLVKQPHAQYPVCGKNIDDVLGYM